MPEIDFALADAIRAYQNDGKFNIKTIPNQAVFSLSNNSSNI